MSKIKIADMTDRQLFDHGVAMSTAERKCDTASCPCYLPYWDGKLLPKIGQERYNVFLDGWTYGASEAEEDSWEGQLAARGMVEVDGMRRKAEATTFGFREGDIVRLPKGKSEYRVLSIIGDLVNYEEIAGRWKMFRTGDEARRYTKVAAA